MWPMWGKLIPTCKKRAQMSEKSSEKFSCTRS
jgi:hypothetical protein